MKLELGPCAGKRWGCKMQRFLVPHGIWYQRYEDYCAVVNLVNDQYHYDIYNTWTGKVVHKGDEPSLPKAKAAVFTYYNSVV